MAKRNLNIIIALCAKLKSTGSEMKIEIGFNNIIMLVTTKKS